MLININELYKGKILLIDKPIKWTSFDIVNKIKYKIKKIQKEPKIKIGHSGTLDPFATGLLIICTGLKTKEIQKIQKEKKKYTFIIKLGATTPSYDMETKENKKFNTKHITNTLIKKTINKFLGKIKQIPPIYSAIKINGKRLYKLARQGINIKIPPRIVQIEKIQILNIKMPYIKFLVKCGKGTYIRSLAYDIGKELKSGAYLTYLRREKIGNYSIKKAQKIFDINFYN